MPGYSEPGCPAGDHRAELQGVHKYHTITARQGWNPYAGRERTRCLHSDASKNKTREDKRYDESKRKCSRKALKAAGSKQQQILRDLLALGKKNGRLTLKEIADALSHLELESEDIDKVYETLETMGIEVETNGVLEKVIGDDDDSFEPEEGGRGSGGRAGRYLCHG